MRKGVAGGLVAALLGCAQPAKTPRSRLVIAQPSTAVTLDPHHHDSYNTNLTLSHFYDKLVMLGAGLEPRPALAVSWENPSDRVWRFRLRQGVKFHDGRPCEAADVVASLERARGPKSEMGHYLSAVSSVRAVDSSTVEVLTKEPSAVLLFNLVFVSVVPRDAPADITAPIGTGSYRFVSGKPGGTIEGSVFEGGWAARPAFERVSLTSLTVAEERAKAIAAGNADVVVQLPEEFAEVTESERAARLVTRDEPDVYLLGFSQRAGSPFTDRRLREAVALAVDRRLLLQRGMRGRGSALYQLAPPSVFGYAAELPEMPHDVARAARLVGEAGAPAQPVALLAPDTTKALVAELSRQLAEVGLQVVPTLLSTDKFYLRMLEQNVPLVLVGWRFSNGDASNGLSPLVHSSISGLGLFNRWNYASPAMDQLIDVSERTLDPATRRGLLASAMRLAREDLPILPLVTRASLYAIRSDLVWTPTRDRVHAADFRPR